MAINFFMKFDHKSFIKTFNQILSQMAHARSFISCINNSSLNHCSLLLL